MTREFETEQELIGKFEGLRAKGRAGETGSPARRRGPAAEALAEFVGVILRRMIFDGEELTDLMVPPGLGRRERRERELALMADLVPLVNKRAQGRNISGLNAYGQESA